MSEREIIKTSATIQLNCLNYVKTLKHENVLIYMPSKSEVKTDAIRKKMLNKNKKVYIPRVLEENKLHFNKFVSEDNLVINKFNILESIDQAILPAWTMMHHCCNTEEGCACGHSSGPEKHCCGDLHRYPGLLQPWRQRWRRSW